jgi:predicted 3-demethylubiquinone-9 3-methyltransferase (glyoxalase superfamily)
LGELLIGARAAEVGGVRVSGAHDRIEDAEFGVSWQLVPANLAEFMSRPGSYDKLISMMNLEVAAFG